MGMAQDWIDEKSNRSHHKSCSRPRLRTDWIKHIIEKSDILLKYRICQTKDKSAIMHIATGCESIVKWQYMTLSEEEFIGNFKENMG